MPKGNRRVAMFVVGALVVATLGIAGGLSITALQANVAANARYDAAWAEASQVRDQTASERAAYEAELADARAAVTGSEILATSGAGYFDAALIAAVAPPVTALKADLPDAGPAAAVLKQPERPSSTSELDAVADDLEQWAVKTLADAATVKVAFDGVSKDFPAAHEAILDVARTVTAQAAASLSAAPSASADTRNAVNAARDAVVAAIRSNADPIHSLTDYTDTVAALNDSQAAAVAAASAAAATGGGGGGGGNGSQASDADLSALAHGICERKPVPTESARYPCTVELFGQTYTFYS